MNSRLARGAIWSLLAVPAAVLVIGLLAPLTTTRGWQALLTVISTQSGLIGNTFAYCLATAGAGTGLGWLFAHVLHLYHTPGRRILHTLCVAPLVLPSFTFAMSLIVLFGHNGLVTDRLAPGIDVYGFPGLVLAGTISRFPFAYLNLSWAYRRLTPSLLEAARELGASASQVTRRLVVPRLAPAMLSSALILFVDAMADVAIPLVIGGGFPTLATRMYEAISSEGDPAAAAAYALLLTLPSAVLWLLAFRLVREHPNPIGTAPQTRLRSPAATGRGLQMIAWATAAMVLVLLLTIVAGALTGPSGALSLTPIKQLLTGPGARPLAMSLVVALVAAPLVMILAFGLALAASRDRKRLRRAYLALQAASALPATVLGLGAYLVLTTCESWLSQAGLSPRATPWLALVAILTVHVVRFTPRVALPVLISVGQLLPQLHDQAILLGARPRDLRRALIWPHTRDEIAGGGLSVFAETITAVSSVILLTNSQVPLLPVKMLVDTDAGRLQAASAATVLLGLTVLAGAAIVQLWRSSWTGLRQPSSAGEQR